LESTDQGLEFAALRATIRERGTLRMVLVPVIFIGWAGVAVATVAVITVALSTLLPLLVLAAGFETLFALHVNIERIGRYVQAFHEPASSSLPPLSISSPRRSGASRGKSL